MNPASPRLAIPTSVLVLLAVAHGPALAEAPPRLVVVAPKRFHAVLADYVRHKQRQLPTDLLCLERILKTTPGVDDPERLKRRIHEGWKEKGWRYVLLVGDADVLPVRYMVLDRKTPKAYDYAFYPSDLYYADLAKPDRTFDDWNACKDGFHKGYFGEVRGEKNKNDRWERSLKLAHLPKIDNADHLPVVISAGCSTARFATLPPYEPYLDVDGNQHRGTDHGQAFEEPPPPPAPYQTGKYNRTGLGEGLVCKGSNGAVAYIGCNTGSQPCALSLVEGFVCGLRGTKRPRLGDIWNQAIRHYYKKEKLPTLRPTQSWYPPSIFFQGMKFMVFGDPSLLIRRTPPQEVSHQPPLPSTPRLPSRQRQAVSEPACPQAGPP